MAKGMPFRQKVPKCHPPEQSHPATRISLVLHPRPSSPLCLQLLIAVIVILIFIAFAAWNNFDDSINWWILWTVPIIFLASWLLVDCMFLDDRDFIFDHDYEVSCAQMLSSDWKYSIAASSTCCWESESSTFRTV
jgi:hypothetical protein